MFDFGAGELVVIGVVALVAIGPKELPGLLRTVGQAVGRLRRMAGDFQSQFNDAMREADMADAQKLIADIKNDFSGANSSSSMNPVMPSMASESTSEPTSTSMTPVAEPNTATTEPAKIEESIASPEPVADLSYSETGSAAVVENAVDEPPAKPKRKRTKKADAEPQEGSS